MLATGEQQRLAFARLLLAAPRFALLDEATSALEEATARQLYAALERTDTSYVTVAGDATLRPYHDQVVELGMNGEWTAEPVVALVSA
jgi:putative ATP-binding cassette transporter